jgi:hypothetical protein
MVLSPGFTFGYSKGIAMESRASEEDVSMLVRAVKKAHSLDSGVEEERRKYGSSGLI